ncbi:MAG: hypothetical protein J6N45_08465 [Alphaproteobacteria bacterium]|nr:hypothetical protein [Alphaproteobacteria bacterium]
MTKRNPYIINETAEFNIFLEKLPEIKDPDKVLRTLEVMEDKAEVTGGDQKLKEISAICKTVPNNLDNDALLKRCFETLAILGTEGGKHYHVGEDRYRVSEYTIDYIDLLCKENPKLKKYADETIKTISENNQNKLFESVLYGDTEYIEQQKNRAWMRHERLEEKRNAKGERATKAQIREYEKGKMNFKPTMLDKVKE